MAEKGIYIPYPPSPATPTAWLQLGRGILPVDTTPPTVPTAVASTATSSTLTQTWHASSDTETGVGGYDVAIDNGPYVSLGDVLTYTWTGLAPQSSHTLKVRARDKAASPNVSAAATITATTAAVASTSPQNLVLSSAAPTTLAFAWTTPPSTPAGTTLTGYEWRIGTGAFASNGTALAKSVTGLTESTDYTFGVRAVFSNGTASAEVTMTTRTPSTSGGTVATLMGTSWNSTSQYANWDVWRVYALNTAESAVAKGAKIVAVTDDPNGSFTRTGGATTANTLRATLTSFYGKTGTPSKNAGVQFHVANGNEVDREGITNLTAFANTYELMETVVADFPMASLWFDATRNGLSQNTTQPLLAAKATSGRTVAQMLDGLAGSYYPPAVFTGFPNPKASDYTVSSQITAVIAFYMAAHSQFGIKKAAIWEFGHNLAWNPQPGQANAGGTYRDDVKRRDFTKQFAQAWLQACLSNGVEPVTACYWDRDGSAGGQGGADVRFSLDQSLATPNTAAVWHDAAATFNAH